ncbi:MAG: cyanophycinase [Acidobacteriota bacterium]|nr:cyanophycinase [Acidobacteriota bacterium]
MSKSDNAAGALVIIGGSEDHRGERRILAEFVRLSGGADASIVIITVASEAQSEVGDHYREVFTGLGVLEARALNINRRGDANTRASVEIVEKATGVFFTGGNQLRITMLLGGTKVDTALHRRNEQGLVLAGTSAGAAMMSTVMITGGKPGTAFRLGLVELSPGMGFIGGVLIDQHFEERGRLRRLLTAVAQYPQEIGLGIDENTAVVVRDQELEVLGHGSVTVIDAGGMSYTNLASLKKDDMLTLCGVKIHILSEGYRFDLRNREPLIEADSEAQKAKEAKRA